MKISEDWEFRIYYDKYIKTWICECSAFGPLKAASPKYPGCAYRKMSEIIGKIPPTDESKEKL